MIFDGKTSKDVKRVKDLMTNPELVRFFTEEEQMIIPREDSSLFKLINYNITTLPPNLKSTFWSILQLGLATIGEIADTLEDTPENCQPRVNDLINIGCVKTVIQDGIRKYAVSEVWKREHFPEGPIIPLIYQYNLLSDSPRNDSWEDAIKKVVKEGDVVADLGAGTGLLSHMSIRQGARVYAVEIDPNIADIGRAIARENGLDDIGYIVGDARHVSLPEKADVVACEMFDTALIAEHIVSVINSVWKNKLLKDGGTVIPYAAHTSAQLVNFNTDFKGSQFRLIHYEAYGSSVAQSLSEEHSYHSINFMEQNIENVDTEIVIPVTRSGVVNGVRLLTQAELTKGGKLTECTDWFNPPVVLPAENDMHVSIGDKIGVRLWYVLGGGWSSLVYRIFKVEE